MKAVSYQLSVVSIQLSAISATRRVHGGRSLIGKAVTYAYMRWDNMRQLNRICRK